MLLLTRKPSESIAIQLGDKQMVATVLGIRGNQVRLGFTGDPSIKILRTELALKDKRNGQK